MKKTHYHLLIDDLVLTTVGVVIVINVWRIAAAKLGTMQGVPGRIGHAALTLVTFSGG
jgi:hypothetical protein